MKNRVLVFTALIISFVFAHRACAQSTKIPTPVSQTKATDRTIEKSVPKDKTG